MPGATRYFESNAARQRAYRRRKQEEAAAERKEAAAEQKEAVLTSAYAHVIQAAVRAAGQRGDPLAQAVYRPDAFETLRAVADHFYDRAGTPPQERAWRE